MTDETENPDREVSERLDARASPRRPPRRARGDGSIFQKRYTDKRTGKTRKTSMLYMKFYVGGSPKVEPTGTTKHTEARKILRRKLAEIATGRYIPADVDKTTFRQIKDMLMNHYRANARKSLDRVEDALIHLEGFFGLNRRVRDIASDRITAYIAARRNEDAANATINRELAALKLMLRLGERAGKVVNRPYIGMLEENNKRKGFFEAEQCEAVRRHLSGDLKPVFEVAYIHGVAGEGRDPDPAEVPSRHQGRMAEARTGRDQEQRGPNVPDFDGREAPRRLSASACADRVGREGDRSDHPLALPSQREAHQVVPPCVAHRM
jgi:hypothetical protein